MTISADYAPNIDLGNGVTTAFAVNFPFAAQSDLALSLYDTVAGADVFPAPALNGNNTYDYTVSGTPDADTGIYPTGTVTFRTAPPATYKVVRKRATPQRQNTALTNNGPFPAKTVEGSFDRAEMQAQEVAARVSLALTAPAAVQPVSMEIPAAWFAGGQVLAYDPLNKVVTTEDPMVTRAEAAAAAAEGAAALVGAASGIFDLPVKSVLGTPPGSPVVGDRYLVAHSGTSGAWVGKEDQVAQYTATGWAYGLALEGLTLFVQNSYIEYRYKGSAWNKSRVLLSPGDTLATGFAAGVAAIVMLAGTYTSVGVTVPSNCTLTAVGQVILQTTSTSTPILDFTNASNVMMRGNWKLQGNGSANTGTPLTGATNSGQVGIKLYNSIGIDIDGFIEICNIKGYGVDEHAPSSSFAVPGLNSFKGLRVHDCYFGAYVRDYAEYSNYTSCWFYKNIAGLKDESGNRGFYNCHFVFNNYGVFLDGTVLTGNNSHGIVSGCFINHNQLNVTCDGTQLGMLFTSCQILSDQTGSGHGTINIIDGAKLINFVGCGIGSDVNIDATSQASFVGNTIRSTLANAPVVTAGGVITGNGNVNELGVQAFLWNGMNSWTPTLSFGGASVGIVYVEADGRYRIADGYLEFIGQIVLSSKGSSTGIALIGGLPKVSGPVPNNIPVLVNGATMAAAVTDLKGFVTTATSSVKLFNFNAGALTQITDTAFTGGDTLYFSGRVPLAKQSVCRTPPGA